MLSRQAARITATIGVLSAATITVIALSGQVPATSGATTTLSPVADGYAQDNMPVHGPWKDAVPALQEGTTLGTSWTRASTGADRGTASVKHQVDRRVNHQVGQDNLCGCGRSATSGCVFWRSLSYSVCPPRAPWGR